LGQEVIDFRADLPNWCYKHQKEKEKEDNFCPECGMEELRQLRSLGDRKKSGKKRKRERKGKYDIDYNVIARALKTGVIKNRRVTYKQRILFKNLIKGKAR